MLRSMPTWPVAALSLVAGFAVAQGTGVRALGGAVLLVGAAWCVKRWRELAGTAVAAALAGLYVAGFVASHVLADALGAWPSVVLVAALVGLAAWSAADRGRRPAAAG